MRARHLIAFMIALLAAPFTRAEEPLFARDNLVAWCIVPFDAKKRGPEERAEMLEKLGFTHFAYDWRAEHVPTFDAEIDALQKHKIAAGKIDCSVELYNHGGWLGEPETMVALAEALKESHVGIIYNLHHGHDHLDRLPEALKKMMPYLHAINLNGMAREGESKGEKILPIGKGELDLQILKTIRDSGYKGRIGILNHTNEDAETRLKENLAGLAELAKKLNTK